LELLYVTKRLVLLVTPNAGLNAAFFDSAAPANRLPFSAPPWLSASGGPPDPRVLGDAPTGVIFDLFWRRDVLGLAVTKGPIFLRDFNKVDEDIFLANLYSFVEMVRQCFVETLLQLSGTAAIQCDLKKDAIVRPMYVEILSIQWQARLVCSVIT
jgi:hypothetical protein